MAKTYVVQGDPRFQFLTPREVDMLHGIRDGLTDRQIARRFRITEKTVGTHMTSLRRKLGVHSRLQALLEAVRGGVIRLEPRPDPPVLGTHNSHADQPSQ